MLDQTDITRIVTDVLEVYKKNRDWTLDDLYKGGRKGPEYYPGYLDLLHEWQEILVHSKKGIIPEKIISARAPNMTDRELAYIRENYKQVTLPVFVDYINTILRCFSDNNWSIDFPEDDGKEGGFRSYVEKEITRTPLKMSVEEYVKHVIPTIKTQDAMGCIAMKPWRVLSEEINGEMVISSELFEPIPVYYPIDRLHSYQDGEYYLFLTYEHSLVEVGNRQEKTGFIYELYDNQAIYRIVQTGAKKDNRFDIQVYYVHQQDDIPVSRLKGFPSPVEGRMQWSSPYGYAVPILDDVVIDSNMLRGVKASCMFPYRVMTGNTCEEKMDLNGEIKCCDGRGWFDDFERNTVIKCPGCGGSGLKDRISPYGVMLMKPETVGEQGEMKATQPAMYFVAPDVAVPKFNRDEIENGLKRARQILHLRDSETRVASNENSTATGMVLDEKAKYAFIKPISDQIFELYDFILTWTGIIRYGEKQPYVLISPITFDFKTEYDYLMEISEAIKNGLPPFVVHTIVFKYLKTMFYNQLETASAFDLIVRSDRLLVMDNDEVSIKLSKGTVQKWESILHDSAVSFIIELQSENPNFFNQDTLTQQEQLVAKAKKKAEETKQATPLSPTDVVRGILNPA